MNSGGMGLGELSGVCDSPTCLIHHSNHAKTTKAIHFAHMNNTGYMVYNRNIMESDMKRAKSLTTEENCLIPDSSR